jgi:hypothetical protein
MKYLIFILVFVTVPYLLGVAQDKHLAIISDPGKEGVAAIDNSKVVQKFSFESYADWAVKESGLEPHFLGEMIARKWTYVNSIYIRKQEVEVGFGASYTETYKPNVINAVYRVNNYYRRALNRNQMNEDYARQQFSHILDCAIAAFYSEDSAEFEKALAGKKKPEEIILTFNLVELFNYHK